MNGLNGREARRRGTASRVEIVRFPIIASPSGSLSLISVSLSLREEETLHFFLISAHTITPKPHKPTKMKRLLDKILLI